MKVILSIIMLCAVAIFILGCNVTEEETSESDLKIPENENPQLSETDDNANGSGNEEDVDLYVFNNEEDEMARKYASDFFETIMFIYSGGDKSPGSFEFEGEEFRYLDKEIATNIKELEDYLSHIFTPGFTEVVIEEMMIIEKEGLLALPKFDYSLSLNFNDAVITPEPDTEADKAYCIEIILFGSNVHTYTMELMHINEKWLIDGMEPEPCDCCGKLR